MLNMIGKNPFKFSISLQIEFVYQLKLTQFLYKLNSSYIQQVPPYKYRMHSRLQQLRCWGSPFISLESQFLRRLSYFCWLNLKLKCNWTFKIKLIFILIIIVMNFVVVCLIFYYFFWPHVFTVTLVLTFEYEYIIFCIEISLKLLLLIYVWNYVFVFISFSIWKLAAPWQFYRRCLKFLASYSFHVFNN